MTKLWELILEGGYPSLTRVLVVFGYVTFIGVSLYLALLGKTWGNYGEFALATGGSVLIQICNKYVNSKYNTPLGEIGKQVKNVIQE